MNTNLIKIFSLFLSCTFFMISCKKDNNDALKYKGDDAFWFQDGTATIVESSSDSIVINVVHTKLVPKTGSVTYTISGGTQGVDFDITTPLTLNYSDSTYTQTIVFKPVDNFDASGNKEITLTLVSAVNGNVGLPGDSSHNKIFVITINDDDCPWTIEDFASTSYTVNEEYPDGSTYAGNPISVALASIGSDTLVVSNLGDWDGEDAYLVFNSDYSITILHTPCNTVYAPPGSYWSGTGSYNPCTRKFVVNYDLVTANGNSMGFPAKNTFNP